MPTPSDLLKDLMLIQKRLNSLFDESQPAFDAALMPARSAGYWTPLVDCYETDDKYAITAELPGVSREDIDLQVRGRKIILSGERKLSLGIPKENYHRVECASGKFQRTLEFSSEIDETRIDAQLTDGVLRITLPKRTASSRIIPIERRE
jgi:HSP20 family protein